MGSQSRILPFRPELPHPAFFEDRHIILQIVQRRKKQVLHPHTGVIIVNDNRAQICSSFQDFFVVLPLPATRIANAV